MYLNLWIEELMKEWGLAGVNHCEAFNFKAPTSSP